MPCIKDYEYELPKELIAQEPLRNRDESRLLIYHLKDKQIEHKKFKDIIDYFQPGDMIVVNETKVIKTRLFGHKETGGSASITIVKKISKNKYDVFVRAKNPHLGTRIIFDVDGDEELVGEIIGTDKERFVIKFNKNVSRILEKNGDYTLPGYIKNLNYDRSRYQTLFAKSEGSIAAPTAGLHFSKNLIDKLKKKGIVFAEICLHISLGTFQEVKVNDYTKHDMHEEWVRITKETAEMINNRKGRLIVVGTTSLRALETATDRNGKIKPFNGFTKLFIYPGYKFRLKFDAMITNFHLPRSTLLLLIASIIGNDWKYVYDEAIKNRYRFYSFGDAMLILK